VATRLSYEAWRAGKTEVDAARCVEEVLAARRDAGRTCRRWQSPARRSCGAGLRLERGGCRLKGGDGR
jgi:hypothetical protein